MLYNFVMFMIQAVNRHIPILVRTMGSSPELLEIVADPPAGSEDLLKQVMRVENACMDYFSIVL